MSSIARPSLRRALPILGALFLATLSCGREITGPGGGVRFMRGFSFEARFGSGAIANGVASELVPYDRVRVLLVDSGGVARVNRVLPFPSTDSVVSLSIDVPLSLSTPASGERMDLSLAYITSAGDTVFRGGPLAVLVVPSTAGSQPPPPPVIPVDYVGPGAEATRVAIAPRSDTVVAGEPFAFTAAAADDGGQPVPGAPIAWRSLTPTVAAVSAPTAGLGTALPARGEALIVAQLLTGPADTVRLQVLPRAQGLVTVSGGGQSALVGGLLAQPVVVRVLATDGQPMEGVTVTFAPTNGGSVGTTSAVSDALGLAQTTWTLGNVVGAQSLSVTAAGVTTPLVVAATATTPVVTLLHHYPMAIALSDVVGGANGTLFGGGVTGDGVLRLNGAGEYGILPGALVPRTGSWSVSLFVRPNVASQAQAYLSQGIAGGPGLVIGATATNELRVGETWTATGVTAPAADGVFHHVVVAVDSIAGTTSLYVDGVLRASQNAVVTIGAGGSTTRIGRSFDTQLENFNGDIDEVRIYGGALTAAAITALYESGVSATDRLVFGTQPSNAVDGEVMTPAVTVRVEDALGRLRTGFTGAVTVELASGSGATLGGTLTVNAVAGVATFANLTLTGAASGARLVATASGIASVESAPFDVTGGVAVNAWAAATSGNWSVGTNWSLGRAPQAGDSVVIALDGTYTVTLDVPGTVGALTVGGGTGTKTLNLSGQTLQVGSSFTVQSGSAMVMALGTTISGGTLNNGGLITMNGGTIASALVNAGTVLVRGGQAITGAITTLPGSTIRVQGNGGVGPVGLTVANGFTNNGTIDLTSADGPWDSQLAVTSGTLINAAGGVIAAGSAAGGNRTLVGSFVNQGSLLVSTTLFISGTFEQQATATGTGAGTISLTSGSTLRLLDAATNISIANGGTVEVSGLNVLAGAFTNGPGAVLRVGAIGAAGDSTNLDIASDVTNSGLIELTNQRTTAAPHAVVLRAGGTLTNAVGGTIRTLAGNGGGARVITSTLTNLGLVEVTPGAAGELRLTSSFSNAGTVRLDIGGATAVAQHDRITVSGATALGAGGTLIATLVGGYVPPLGAVFDVLTASVVTGSFTTVTADAPLLPSATYPGGVVRLSGPVSALANEWTNASGGTWSTGSNWSLGRAPISTDTVLITLAGSYTVTLDAEAQVGTLVVGGASGAQTFAMGTRSLTLSGLMSVGSSGIVTASTGSILGTGSVVNGGSMDVTNRDFLVPVTNSGTIVIRGSSEFRAPSSTTAGSMLRILGSSAGSSARLDVSADFTNGGTIELTSIDGGFASNLVLPSGWTLTNLATGTIRTLAGAGGNRGISGVWVNEGSMEFNTTVTIGGNNGGFVNTGTITQTAGLFELFATGTAPTFENNGTINLGANGNFQLIGSGTTLAVDLRGGLVQGVQGTLSLSFATLRMTTANLRARLNLGSSPLLDSLVIPAGDTLRLTSGALDGPALVNEGVLQVFGSAVVLAPFSNAAGAQMLVRGSAAGNSADLRIANGFTNHGDILMTSIDAGYSSRLEVTAGTLVNSPTGTITSLQGTGGARTLAAELDNRGSVSLLGASGFTLGRASAAHVNSGTITVTGSNLFVTQSGTDPSFTNDATGVIALANGRTFNIAGGLVDLRTGIVRNDSAFVTTTGATTVRFLTSTVEPRVTFSATTVLPDPFLVPGGDSLRIFGGTFAPPALRNDGTLILGGAPSINTVFTMADSSRLLLRGDAVANAVNATFTNAFTNTARIDLTSESAGYSATLTVPTGTLVNAASGVINVLSGAGGARTLALELDNQGVLNLSTTSGLTLGRSDAAHVNAGTINVTGSNLTLTQTGTAPSFTNTAAGVVQLANNRTWTTNGGLLDLRTGIVRNDSAFVATAGATTVRFFTSTVEPRVTFSAATVLPDSFTVPAGDSLRIFGGTFAPPSLRNDGTLIVGGTATITTAFTMADTSRLLLRGDGVANAVNATFTNAFTNTARIDLTSETAGYNATLTVPTGALVNAATGVINALPGAGGARTLAVELNNQGVLNLSTASGLTLSRADAAHVNAGTINVTGSNLTLTQTGTAPSFTNTAAGVVQLANNRTWTTNGGLLDLRTGIVRNDSAFVTTSGATTVRFLTTTVEPRVTFSAATVLPDPFLVPAGDSLRIFGGTFAPPTLRNDGTLIVGGAATITTAFTMADTSRLLLRGDAVANAVNATFTNAFTNTARIDLTSESAGYSATLTVPTGTLVNAATGVINVLPGAGGARTLAVELANQGALNLTTASGLTLARADAAHLNTGTINVTGSNLTLTQTGTSPSFTNGSTGLVALGNNRTWTTNGGLLDLRTGLVSNGAAFLSATGTTTVRFLTSTVQPRVTFVATTILPDAFTVPAGDSLRVFGGTFAPPSLRNDGTLIIGGATTINTAFTMADTSLLLVRGDAVSNAVNATFTNGFTNTGRIDLTSETAGYSSTLTVPTGALVNASSGIINVLPGAGGARTLALQLENQGVLNLTTASGLTLARADAAHLNTGTINVTGSNLTLTQTGTAPSFTNGATGLVALSNNRTWTTNGGLLDLRTGLVSNTAAFLSATGTTTVRFLTSTVQPRVTFAATTILPDAFTVPAGDSLRVFGGTFAPPSLLVQGRLALEGTATVNTAVTSDSGSQIVVRGNATGNAVNATFTNALTVGPDAFLDLTTEDAGYAVALNVTSGSLTIAPTAQFSSLAGAGGTRTIGAQLVNQGSVQINTATTLARADAAHVNAAGANIAVFGGNLTVTQTGTAPTFTNNGTINVAATRSFIGNGGAFNLETGTMLGSTGTFQTLGTVVARFQPANVRPALAFSAGTTVPVAFVIPTLTDTVRVRGGVFAPTSLVNNGQLLLEGVATINATTFSNEATGVVSVQGTTPLGNANISIPQGMTNSGTLRLTTIGAGYAVALTFGSSTLTNAVGSTLEIAQGAGGSRSLTAGLIDNFGTMAGNATGTIAGPVSQRGLLTVAASRTLTLSSPLTLFSLSTVNVTTGGTLAANGGCTNLGAQSLVNFVCP